MPPARARRERARASNGRPPTPPPTSSSPPRARAGRGGAGLTDAARGWGRKGAGPRRRRRLFPLPRPTKLY